MELAISGAEERYRGVPVSVLLGDAKEHGANYIEFWHPWNTVAEGVEGSLATIQESGIQVAAMSSLAHLVSPGGVASQQRVLLEAIEIADRVGARLVNTYFGHGEERDDDKLISQYSENLAPCLEKAVGYGVTIVLENECDVAAEDPDETDITRRPESIRALVEHINSPNFRLTFDAVNFYLAGVEPFPHAYNVLCDYVSYVHLKDGAVYRAADYADDVRTWQEHGGWYVALPLGEGAVNHEGLLARLKADGYDGFVTLEPHVPESHLRATYRASIDYLTGHEVWS